MDIAKRIHDVGACWNNFAVDKYFGTDVPAHGGMWLSNSEGLLNHRIKERSVRFPYFKGNRA